ncbi:hypothetical protein SMSP2_00218 [Limihaloglobus sulfuriphilus]|uniref:Porin n=1 Tax=Limihaloglobus sulfuriphilus TaxID=1851148 RepID=A0A1Q2MB32_9BACT|nr:hypothetical protein [Limihaloglobus sulfuriphilus]AQQ69884.1 hypothetical protein SMSP2_00218 [Limihaloglobus sulfuriphilus]
MKKLTLLIAMIGMTAGAFAMDEVGVTLDATYMSKYLWNGYDIYDDKGAYEVGVMMDFGETGFYGGVSYINALSSGNVYAGPMATGGMPAYNLAEFDYKLGYKSVVLEGEALESTYDLKYVYHDLGDWPSGWGAPDECDFQEVSIYVEMPNLDLAGIKPHFSVLYTWDGFDGGTKDTFTGYYGAIGTGWISAVGLSYDLVTDGFTAENPEQVFTFVGDVVYSSSVADFNSTTLGSQESGWTHFVVGCQTDFNMFNGVLTPGVYYQTAFSGSRQDLKPSFGAGDSLIDNDLYATVTYSLSF